MVEVIKPEAGEKMFLDPACGSGGMFVQAARYMHKHNKNADRMQFRCYGVEKEPDTVKLAKMNLILNNVRGEITEANSFYSDPYNAVGQFDYVMANPPFNVDEVLYERVKDDPRFNTYGMTKGTKGKGKDAKETVSNANYLWISYFATALKNTGRAALVMANIASDAGSNDLEIRKTMIKAGIIKQMVTLPSNMFTSVTLPATLWFFDKAKPENQKNKILFLDARNIFTQIDRAHRKFSDEQIKNLGIITRLYDGDIDAFESLILEYKEKAVGDNKEYFESQIQWLLERFPEHKYRDVVGLCKVAEVGEVYDEEGKLSNILEDSIADQDWSLNAGRYVGVVIEDDGLTEDEFVQYTKSLNEKFNSLSEEATSLEQNIAKNMKKILGD